jgi:glucose/arabinose dehydrogenase
MNGIANQLCRASAISAFILLASSALPAGSATSAGNAPACPGGDAGITLSPGFCATIFADNLGHVRHLVVTPDGIVYANTWSGRYYHNVKPPPGGFLLALQDTDGSGRANVIQRFGATQGEGAAGGTGIAFHDNAIYAEEKDKIVRYARKTGEIVPSGKPDVILSGMPLTGDHPMHPFVIDAKGALFVDSGSATNSCQSDNRMLVSAGIQPCTELETRAGTWRYEADKTGQVFSAGERFATGIRNGEGFAFDAAGRLFVTQHGRDQLSQNWPKLYTVEQGADLPAEEVLQLHQGADFGWPTRTRASLCLRRNMAATAARRPAFATANKAPSPRFLAIGRRTTCSSIPAASFPSPIAAAPSSPSTAPGTARRCRKAATTWSSSRWPMARSPVTT